MSINSTVCNTDQRIHNRHCLLTNVGRRVGRSVGKSVGIKVGAKVLSKKKQKRKLRYQYATLKLIIEIKFTHGSNVGDNVGARVLLKGRIEEWLGLLQKELKYVATCII